MNKGYIVEELIRLFLFIYFLEIFTFIIGVC